MLCHGSSGSRYGQTALSIINVLSPISALRAMAEGIRLWAKAQRPSKKVKKPLQTFVWILVRMATTVYSEGDHIIAAGGS